MEGLDEAGAKRLESGRPVFIDLEMRVLRRLATALRSRDATNLWRHSLALITDAVLATDAAFYLEIDRLYTSAVLPRSGSALASGA